MTYSTQASNNCLPRSTRRTRRHAPFCFFPPLRWARGWTPSSLSAVTAALSSPSSSFYPSPLRVHCQAYHASQSANELSNILPISSSAVPERKLDQALVPWLEKHTSLPSFSSATPLLPPTLLDVRPSSIPNAGRGLWLKPYQTVAKGDILTLYPGLIYELPHDLAALMPSEDAFAFAPPDFMIGNAFLLRVSVSSRDFLCDGRPFGLSAHMFRAISRRQHERLGLQVNDAWLEGEGEGGKENGKGTAKEKGAEGGGKRSSLAWGHLINDPQGSGGRPNVAFRTIRVTVAASAAPAAPASSFPPSFPPSLLPSLPTLSASGNNARERVVIAVVAVEAMEGGAEGKELFVQYSQEPTHLGYI